MCKTEVRCVNRAFTSAAARWTARSRAPVKCGRSGGRCFDPHSELSKENNYSTTSACVKQFLVGNAEHVGLTVSQNASAELAERGQGKQGAVGVRLLHQQRDFLSPGEKQLPSTSP